MTKSPINDPKALLNEYADAASALCDWFESQDISVPRSVAIMSYLIGVMAAEGSADTADALVKVQRSAVASKLICVSAMLAKG